MYLFDTDAISEVLKPRPAPAYLEWLAHIPSEVQHVSTVTIGELFAGAFLSAHVDRHLRNIRSLVLPLLRVVPFDVSSAEHYGRIRAIMRQTGRPLPDADTQIAATALAHDLTLVTGNVRHFEHIPGLRIDLALASTRPPPKQRST